MSAKIKITLNYEVHEKAKLYASKNNLSLSKLIENHLIDLTTETKSEIQISDFVKSMSSELKIPNDFDYKKDRANFLVKKDI